MTDRVAGVLLHPTSLPGPGPAGDLGPCADAFLEWAASAGFRLWQVLPLGPSATGDSPYSALSAFALDPLLISLERLVADGLLEAAALPGAADRTGNCDFAAARELKAPLFRQAWERFQHQPPGGLQGAFDDFCHDPLQQAWLEDWCLFMALRRRYGNGGWWTWPEPLRDRQSAALDVARQDLASDVDFERFLQFCAARHWQQVRQTASRLGITILGDLPIYVAHDSAEVWAAPHLFSLDDAGRPTAVAGVPPDYFAEDGQLWGNPLYRWETMAEDGYRWWMDRLRANLALADLVRLDHFRAFADYWQIPVDADTARHGGWQDGPGKPFFDAIAAALGTPVPLIAEDLGDLSDKVHELRRATQLPGMKVMQFGFDPPESDHAPFHLEAQTLYYTATHDNDTSVSWFQSLSDDTKGRIRALTGDCSPGGSGPGSSGPLHQQLIRLAFASVARWAVVPMQDILGLGNEARMNTPGVADGNWRWRLHELPNTEDAKWLRQLAIASGRLELSDK